jgi:hypothetical protein
MTANPSPARRAICPPRRTVCPPRLPTGAPLVVALLLALATALGSTAAPASAQAEPAGERPATFPREGTRGIGLQLSWPAFGISGMLDVADQVTIQGVLGGHMYGATLAGRGIYRFHPQDIWTPFAYGQVGLWTDYKTHGAVPNFGAGGGVEVDVRSFIPESPPIMAAFEAGIISVFHGDGPRVWLQIGPAVHYRF